MRDRDTETVITTPAFRAGQAQAHADFERGSNSPNALLNRAPAEFRAGYLHEWREYIAPFVPREGLQMWPSPHQPEVSPGPGAGIKKV